MNYFIGIFIFLITSLGLGHEKSSQCKSEKTYLEEDIGNFLSAYSHEASSDMTKPSFLSSLRQKIATSQKLAPLTSFAPRSPHIFYAHCPDGSTLEYKNRPCLTQNYVLAMAAIFDDVVACAGIDSKKFFKIIHYEGRFQANIANKNGMYCAGQISDIAIKDIHRLFNTKNSSFHDLISKDFVPNHKDPLRLDSFQGLFSSSKCEAFKKFTPTPYNSLSPCEKVAFPQGSYLCLMYSALYYRHLKDRMKKKILSGDHSLQVSSKELEDIAYRLSLYAYNGGVSEIAHLLADFMAKFTAQNELSAKAFENFRNYLAKNYYRSVLEKIKDILKTGSEAKLTQFALGHGILAPLVKSIDHQFHSCREMAEKEDGLKRCYTARGSRRYGVCDIICKIKWKRKEVITYADRILDSTVPLRGKTPHNPMYNMAPTTGRGIRPGYY
ncbi:MAG: hypothetical protein OXB88_07040 [Bacteriovoracales bacterium]|nr:hypothetical protein [Bacteriovoracales bacterium]